MLLVPELFLGASGQFPGPRIPLIAALISQGVTIFLQSFVGWKRINPSP
jgi:hypothetical protein